MGYNGCIFAYGQTGSGKTHTILGPAAQDGTLADDPAALGRLPRTLGYMFDEIRRRETQDNVHSSCFVSFMEIYNEKIRDLLNPSNAKKLNIFWILSFFHNSSDPRDCFQGPSDDGGESLHYGRQLGSGCTPLRGARSREPACGCNKHEYALFSLPCCVHSLLNLRGGCM